ncbi:hypothetical protein LF41_1492 [Lysobacter dokdonensis DS-58]|uniref:Uncharacterized protein n=1 Tax=Lysobacter dokdonensis DS-58 TaxID=1300345 RepID=A0A0A2WEI0_9GAMM|nr:hypothetical protein LF41_1492 [Lysobacter dokdonensis DS-58]
MFQGQASIHAGSRYARQAIGCNPAWATNGRRRCNRSRAAGISCSVTPTTHLPRPPRSTP